MNKFLFFGFLILIFFGCKPKLSELPKELDVSNAPDLTVENFQALYKINSRLKAEAFAPLLCKYTRMANKTEFPEGVKVNFFDESVNLSTFLIADYAVNYTAEELWKFEGNVVIKNQDGGFLKTQQLYFDQKSQKIYSVKYVEVINPDGTEIRGKGGFESNLDFSDYKFKNVDGIIKSFKKY